MKFFDFLPQKGFICAHRGARSIAPENTLLALQKASDSAACCWETDVRMSKDGELVIIHDPTLERTTNVAIHEKFKNRDNFQVDQFSVDELRELDAGSWFLTTDPFTTLAHGDIGPREVEMIQGQQVPLLEEVLLFTKAHSFPVNLELKMLDTTPGDVAVVDSVIAMLEKTETTALVLLSSFSREYLYRARELSKSVSIAVLAEDQHPADLIPYLKSLSAVAYHPNIAIYDAELAAQLQRSGFRVNCWTLNDIEQAEKLLQAHVGVVTDWPQRFL